MTNYRWPHSLWGVHVQHRSSLTNKHWQRITGDMPPSARYMCGPMESYHPFAHIPQMATTHPKRLTSNRGIIQHTYIDCASQETCRLVRHVRGLTVIFFKVDARCPRPTPGCLSAQARRFYRKLSHYVCLIIAYLNTARRVIFALWTVAHQFYFPVKYQVRRLQWHSLDHSLPIHCVFPTLIQSH